MIAEENEYGDFKLQITGDLFRLAERVLCIEDENGICWRLSKLSVEKLARLERLATEQPNLAEAIMRKDLSHLGWPLGKNGCGAVDDP